MKENDVLKILHFTDTHVTADPAKLYRGHNADESLQRVIHYVSNHYPRAELALVTGDLVNDDKGGYERVKRRFEMLNMPVYCLPGNHDFPDQMKLVLSGSNVQTGRSVVIRSWQIIMLDSTVTGKVGGHLSAGELDWLDSRLCKYPDHHTLICFHHPPLLTGSYWLDNGLIIDNPEDLFTVIDQHKQVRSVLWGHSHQEFYLRRNGVDYLATPSTMLQFKPNSYDFALDDKPPGFRWLDLHLDGGFETQVVYV
jgi:3',5'-cyclic-AMP phosphodiesterase